MTLFDAYQNYEEHLKSKNQPLGLRRSSWPESWLHVKPGYEDHVTCIRSKDEPEIKAHGYYGSSGFPLKLGIIELCATDWEVVYK